MNNGIWIEEWAKSLGITEPVNGTWIEAIRQHYGGEDVNGTHLMTILHQMGGDISNGTMIEGIMNAMGHSIRNGSISTGIGNLGDTSPSDPPSPPLDPCSIIQNLTTDNIGQLGSSSLFHAWYKLYKYNYSGWLYAQSEIGDCKSITGIEIHTRSSNVSSWDNQRVYMGHITENQFPSSFVISDMTISDLTLVWEGTFDFIYAPNGTLTLNFDTNFVYNGSDNLVIIIDDDSGTYSFSYPLFKGTYDVYLPYDNMAFKKYQDQPINSETDTLSAFNARPNTKLLY